MFREEIGSKYLDVMKKARALAVEFYCCAEILCGTRGGYKSKA